MYEEHMMDVWCLFVTLLGESSWGVAEAWCEGRIGAA